MHLKTTRRFYRWLGLSMVVMVALLAQSSVHWTAFADDPVDTLVIDLASTRGEPTYRASGFLYGLSPDGTEPPIEMQTAIKTQFIRAGGAQLGCPNGGWVNGAYEERWESVKGYYARAKELGATFVMLPHDLWGADGVCNVPEWPGDDGDWTNYITFLNQVISDAIANGMTGPDVHWDIWNEPDITLFWLRSQEQYLETWKLAYEMIRAAIPDAIIVGPSTARQPYPNDYWYRDYLDFVKEHDVIPDIISWHQLVPQKDPQTSKRGIDEMMGERGITVQGYQVNEYGDCCNWEQEPGGSIWYMGRFEREGIDGLRANWRMGADLHGGMGGLTTISGQPLGVWWAYKRYADITGQMVTVTAGKSLDGVAGIDADTRQAIILVGSRAIHGNVVVEIRGFDAAPYLLDDGQVNVLIEQLPAGEGAVTELPIFMNKAMTVTDNVLTLAWDWDIPFGGYVITLTPVSGS